MTVTNVTKDHEALTMTVTAEFDATVKRSWQLWEDPRQLERWWGPPTHPATVVDHDLTPGGSVTYYMTGPEGEKYRGWWKIGVVGAPHRLEFEDGFADDEGNPNLELPTMYVNVSLEETDSGGTQMTMESRFASAEAMEEVLAMGAEEGVRSSMGQIDELLAS